MTEVDDTILSNLSRLSKIHLTASEQQQLRSDLKAAITYVKQLQELDTKAITPYTHPLEDKLFTLPLADDIIDDLISHHDFIANAPKQVAGMIKTPPVII
ncbi:MAG: Asp-tRNA(Asn)/Glu-tRNA(Gln) amidotransferase subunit GatC [Chlamydiota bacterium]